MSLIENLEKMLASGKDSAVLRFSLGNEYHKSKRLDLATTHLEAALRLDPGYSAAWKIYAKVLAENDCKKAAIDAYERGIKAAEAKGDKQAAREMQVFLKRLSK